MWFSKAKLAAARGLGTCLFYATKHVKVLNFKGLIMGKSWKKYSILVDTPCLLLAVTALTKKKYYSLPSQICRIYSLP